jgi:hypothetical protein
MQRYLNPARYAQPSGRYSLAVLPCDDGPVSEAPLSPAQADALASYAQPFKAERPSGAWSPKAPLIDATAGGRFLGWRVP